MKMTVAGKVVIDGGTRVVRLGFRREASSDSRKKGVKTVVGERRNQSVYFCTRRVVYNIVDVMKTMSVSQ